MSYPVRARLFSLLFAAATLIGCSAPPVAAPPTVGPPAGAGGYANEDVMADARSLAGLLTQLTPTDGLAADLVLVDARPRAAYDEGHLLGAVSLPWDELVDENGRPRPATFAAERLGLLGVSAAHRIVTYDAGPRDAAAEQLFWLLEHIGAQHVQVLAGGHDGWTRTGRETVKATPTRDPAVFTVSLRAEALATDAQLREPGAALLVDTRSDAEYIGWPGAGQERGGHLPGAVHFPATWTTGQDGPAPADALSTLVRDKLPPQVAGATPGVLVARRPAGTPLILYSNRMARACQAYYGLRLAGRDRVAVATGGLDAYLAGNPRQRPLDRLARYEKLVGPDWLQALIAGRPVPHEPRARWQVVEVSWGPASNAYDKGHIPGAVHLNTDAIEADTDDSLPRRNWWNLRPADQLERALVGLGVTADTTAIVYGPNHLAAARAAWALRYAGVRDVRLLNGGWRGWVESGGQVSTETTNPTPVQGFGATVPAHPEVRATTEEVRASIGAPDARVVGIRSWQEHIGATSGYDYIEPKGRIAGALWGRGGADAQSVTDFEDPDGTLRCYREVAALWAADGITGDKKVLFYCGTGWRASVAWYYAYLMGWDRAKNYDGGWMEWSMGPDAEKNPRETGVPGK